VRDDGKRSDSIVSLETTRFPQGQSTGYEKIEGSSITPKILAWEKQGWICCELTGRLGILICWGCHSKQKCIFPLFWRTQVQGVGSLAVF
jgi:hypothetical protein